MKIHKCSNCLIKFGNVKNWQQKINKRGFLTVHPKRSMNSGMTCPKITACGNPAVVWLLVHDEKCDYGMSEEKKILLF